MDATGRPPRFPIPGPRGTLTTGQGAGRQPSHRVAPRVRRWKQQIGARLFERLPDRFVPPRRRDLFADTEAMKKRHTVDHRRSGVCSATRERRVRLSPGGGDGRPSRASISPGCSSAAPLEFEVSASQRIANLSRASDLLILEQVGGWVGRLASIRDAQALVGVA